MLILRVFPQLLLLTLALTACGPESPAPETTALTREKPLPPTSLSDPGAPIHNNDGGFESLVADYESEDRVIWQKPDLVISLLGNLEGKTVADIGAGTGYFTFRMVPRAAKVIGIDIDPRLITFMDSVKVRLPAEYRARFESRLAKPDDPLLQPAEADAVMIVNTYGYLENRVAYLKTVAKGMSSGAQLLIIDFKKNNLPVGPPDQFKVALTQVEQELQAAGFTVTKADKETLRYQYIVLARKP